MCPFNCCRTCLDDRSLNPIFSLPEHSEKYTNVIYAATGIKIAMNDMLPQEMCTSCINFINDCTKFRKRCQDAVKTFHDRIENKSNEIKFVPNHIFKVENEKSVFIDISHLIDDFREFEDDVYDYSCETEKPTNNTDFKTQEIAIETEDHKGTLTIESEELISEKKSKVKRRRKKEIGSKKERVRERIECEYCHKILTSRLSLPNHYKIHKGFDVVCEHCGKKFITRRLLLMHCRAKHGYEKTDKCSFCDYTASNAEQVKVHERIHTGEKPFVCSECGAGFHRRSSYLQHTAIHLPEKTVQCDQCPARFKSITLMRIHKNRHKAPQYTFKCKLCDNSFARRRNVARHLQRIHGVAPEQEHIERMKIP